MSMYTHYRGQLSNFVVKGELCFTPVVDKILCIKNGGTLRSQKFWHKNEGEKYITAFTLLSRIWLSEKQFLVTKYFMLVKGGLHISTEKNAITFQ